ncbi:MAG: TldD/PmbA family protein [Acidobacteriota bacterium]|nr:TldD/PmbA family protein [Acidobacteriota bacterium]
MASQLELVASLSDAALGAASEAGATEASVRVEEIRSQSLVLRDGVLETTLDQVESGLGVRVVTEGSTGFAASVELGSDAAALVARQAVEMARLVAPARHSRFTMVAEPGHGLVEYSSSFRVDPTGVSLSDKVALLERWSRSLLAAPAVTHVSAQLLAVSEFKCYADSAGTVARQRRVRIHPVLEVVAVADDGDFETMRTLAPPVGRGWEYLEGDGWDWEAELAALPERVAQKLASPSVEPGRYDLVIDPTNLWLTIHESIGHATELDRALGYEAAYAGTSFATPDRIGSLQYGSGVMNVTGDRTVEHGLATVAIDDEGVEGQRFDLIRDGVLVGFQLDRSVAAIAGENRSNGCAFADSPLHVPIQRMANVSLQPAPDGPSTEELIAGVRRGLYVEGDNSWSIDMQRYNFQFTGQRFWLIEDGRLAGQVRDAAYQATTTDFWGSMEAVGGPGTFLLGGAFNCGKAQPGQTAAVSHGTPSALFRSVNVLNARAESGR